MSPELLAMGVCVMALAMNIAVCVDLQVFGMVLALAIASARVGGLCLGRASAAGEARSPSMPPRPPQWQPELELEYPPAVGPSRCEQPPPPPPALPPIYLARNVVQRGAAVLSFFRDRGFVVVDLGLDETGRAIFANLAIHMAELASDPRIQYNRGPGRTCVNDARNIDSIAWQEALKIILDNVEVKIVISELVKSFQIRFHDCGGDYVEAAERRTTNGERRRRRRRRRRR